MNTDTLAPARRGRPSLNLTDAERAERKRASTRAAVAKIRQAKKAAGVVVVAVELSADEHAELLARREQDKYDPSTFFKRAVILGSKFCANMSQGHRVAARKRGTGGVAVKL